MRFQKFLAGEFLAGAAPAAADDGDVNSFWQHKKETAPIGLRMLMAWRVVPTSLQSSIRVGFYVLFFL